MEEYKKLSELPQAVNPQRCEAYGVENGKSVRVPLNFISQAGLNKAINTETTRAQNAESALQSNIDKETTNRIDADTAFKNTMVKSCVSTDKAFNNVVKELYFDHWCNVNNISKISIKRNGIVAGNTVWEMYFVDNNDTHHWVSFGTKAEQQDVNVAKVEWEANKESSLFNSDKNNRVNCYAVIDWTKVTNQNAIGSGSDVFQGVKISTNVNYNKYFPQINVCIATHKYTHDVEANSVIKELYFKNLKKDGTLISDYDFKREFQILRILRGKETETQTGDQTRTWSLIFYIKNDGGNGHFFKNINQSPENKAVWVIENYNFTIGGYKYTADKVYAVIDWSKLTYGEDRTIEAYLLDPCLHVIDSPIIYNYIENESLRQQIAQLTTSNNTTSEE